MNRKSGPGMNTNPLAIFHPLVDEWFTREIGRPTDVQARAWPMIAEGRHLLITAPTGSGKTLTAFLWALDSLITRRWKPEATRLLYISPLKALNNDIQRNLLTPLEQLRAAFEQAGRDFPDIRVMTRSGDTPQSDRRRMLRRPPEILITTPESLNLLLSSHGGRSILNRIEVVILDEIHAVVGQKRGVHLITAVERLVRLSGEFQRLALSATVKPLEIVAEFVGGYQQIGPPPAQHYVPRPVSLVRSFSAKTHDVRIVFPPESVNQSTRESIWQPLVEEFKRIIGRNRSTLFFTNSRRLSEKITFKINHEEPRVLAYAHHGSLSREIRSEVERRLKDGQLKAIVATNSLEMGIDIGVLDEVVLIQSPASVSSAVQRIGRAGHQVGQAGKSTIFPTHSQDILEAAVLADAVRKHDIETVKPISNALDVLAQVLVSMTALETWDIDDLYAHIRSAYPYQRLDRRQFDLVLQMLAGRYAGSRVRELNPRLTIDRMENTVQAQKGALQVLYGSGGTIPDRGYFHLRRDDTNDMIGELDEEFVWEARLGQMFTLGTQHWKIRRITHNDVFVVPALPTAMAAPFWRGEQISRAFHFSDKIGRLLEDLDDRLEDPGLAADLQANYRMDPSAASALISYLRSQKEATCGPLPHRHHILIEHIRTGPGGSPGNQTVIHAPFGLKVNRPWALALDAAWEAEDRWFKAYHFYH
jgi:ATP-dependent helicase Lhr and Lhr-like helicase